MQALEDQVQGLQEKLKALEIERAHNTAQLDALSQCVRGMELAPRPEAGPESGQEVRGLTKPAMPTRPANPWWHLIGHTHVIQTMC